VGYITIVVTISQLVEVWRMFPPEIPTTTFPLHGKKPVAGHPNHGGFLPNLLLSPKEKGG